MISDVVERYKRDREFQIAEASERQREQLLHHVELQVIVAARAATAAEDTAHQLSRMAAVADWALPAIAEYLALTAERLGGVEQMLANPTETAAAEYYRRGSYALASGWLEEATDDLLEAVRLYPYNARSWFNLGVVRQRNGSVEAGDAFARCARYAAVNDPALSARAVLLGSYAFRAHDRLAESERLLREYSPKLDSVAELHLALGVHHGDLEHLTFALTAAPELAVDARLAGCADVAEAARLVCERQTGPVARLREIGELASSLFDHAIRAGLDGVCSAPVPIAVAPAGFDALLVSHASLPAAVGVIDRLAAEISREHVRRTAALDDATRRVGSILPLVREAEQTLNTLGSTLDARCAELCDHYLEVKAARDEVVAAERRLLEMELVRARTLESIVATLPDLRSHWTNKDYEDQKEMLMTTHTPAANAPVPSSARTWMEVHDWIDYQAYLRAHRSDSSGPFKPHMLDIYEAARRQTEQQVQEIEAALDRARRGAAASPSDAASASTDLRRRAAQAAATVESLPDGAIEPVRALHDALVAANLIARDLLGLAEAADRKHTAYEAAWSWVEELAQRVFGGEAEPCLAGVRASFESAPPGSLPPTMVCGQIRGVLVSPARANKAEAERNLDVIRSEEQRARSLVEATSEPTARAARSVDSARRLAAPQERISPFEGVLA